MIPLVSLELHKKGEAGAASLAAGGAPGVTRRRGAHKENQVNAKSNSQLRLRLVQNGPARCDVLGGWC